MVGYTQPWNYTKSKAPQLVVVKQTIEVHVLASIFFSLYLSASVLLNGVEVKHIVWYSLCVNCNIRICSAICR